HVLARVIVHLFVLSSDQTVPMEDLAELYLATHDTPLHAREYLGAANLLRWIDDATYWSRFKSAFGLSAVVAVNLVNPRPEWLSTEDARAEAWIKRHEVVWHVFTICDGRAQYLLVSPY